VPWVLQQAYYEGGLDEGNIVIHRGSGAVLFCDTSGFSALTCALATAPNGAENLSRCLTRFFTCLINLINDYRGDVIKFSGDAVTAYFPAVDDKKNARYNKVVPPHGTFGLPDLGPMTTAILRACACCVEIHRRLFEYETNVQDVKLSCHIGIGCGQVHIMQVGGVKPPESRVPRVEYIIAGSPIEQIAVAEPLARIGETCVSPQAWEYVKDCVIEGRKLDLRKEYHMLQGMDELKFTYPTIKHAAIENDTRIDKRFKLTELNVIRRYTPSAVFKQIECGTLKYVDEMRTVSTIFVQGNGLDPMTDNGHRQLQELVTKVQTSVYAHEGTMNKFLIDEKGMLFVIVFGLPPLVHQDDPTRAVLACFDMVKEFERLHLQGRFGVTTGRVYCGVCGSDRRREYTVLGEDVNMASRLMALAQFQSILCDLETKNRCSTEIIFNALNPVKVKGKKDFVPVFKPEKTEPAAHIGITPEKKIRFPWYDQPFGGGAGALQQNVQHLCGVKNWAGILKVSEMLGAHFSKTIHQSDQTIPSGPASVKPPAGSPFETGGVVIIEGDTGLGRIELTEHVCVFAAFNLAMLPIIGSMGPRPGDSTKFATEMLRSVLALMRFLSPGTLSFEDVDAIAQVSPAEMKSKVPLLQQALNNPMSKESSQNILDASLDLIVALVPTLSKKTGITVVLQFEYGTSLFWEKCEDKDIFWKVIGKLCVLTEKAKRSKDCAKPVVMVILVKEAAKNHPAVAQAQETNSHLKLEGLSEDNIVEYLCNYLNVTGNVIPTALRQFVSELTLGNPLYIRETVDQLRETEHLIVDESPNKIKAVTIKNLNFEQIDISAWQHTAMVGGTVCQLEALEPLEMSVLKMSICFMGQFTLPDLAASTCSKWSNATHFDFLRLYRALKKLQKEKIIEKVEAPPPSENWNRDVHFAKDELALGSIEYYQTRHALIRAVGGSMVLEAQKKSVKRNALIDRALAKELPEKMRIVASRKSAPHIPWYYEQAIRRMPPKELQQGKS